jgi:hypothetical protein
MYRVLESRGLGPVQLVVDRFDLHELHASDINLLAGALQVREITVSYSPVTLVRRQTVARLEIAGPRLTFGFDGNLARVGKQPVGTSTIPNAGSPLGGWQFDVVDVSDAVLEVETTDDHQEKTPMLRDLPPIRLHVQATRLESQIDFTLHAEIEGARANGKVRLDATGRYNPSKAHGDVRIEVPPVVFHPDGLQPADFLPGLGEQFVDVAGSMALSGTLSWQNAALTPDLIVKLTDVGFRPRGTQVSRMTAAIHLNALQPLATPPGQMLTANVKVGGLPENDVTLRFQLRPNATLMVERLQIGFAGGQIVASPFMLDPATPTADTVLQLDGVDLSQLFGLVGLDGLGGTGQLGGQIPLGVDAGGIRVSDGKLAATGPGVVRFRRDTLPKEISGAGKEMTLALGALEDFHYTSLTLELNKALTGEGAILVRLSGANPAFLAGRSFNFNIRLESNFDRLTALAMRSTDAAWALLRRTERRLPR